MPFVNSNVIIRKDTNHMPPKDRVSKLVYKQAWFIFQPRKRDRYAESGLEDPVDANERDFNTFHLKYQLVAHIGMMEKNSNRRISFTSSTMMCAPPSLFCPCNALSMHQQLYMQIATE